MDKKREGAALHSSSPQPLSLGGRGAARTNAATASPLPAVGECRHPSAEGDGQGEGASPPRERQGDRPLFEALLYPHRSLSERGLLILTIGTIAIVALWGGLFLILGAWPIFGFIGGEWLLFWWLLRTHFRGDRRAERIRLYADRLLLEQIDAKGRVAECTFEPYWLQIILFERGFENPALLLRSHGKAVEIGAFLGAAERRQFADQLEAALARWRST